MNKQACLNKGSLHRDFSGISSFPSVQRCRLFFILPRTRHLGIFYLKLVITFYCLSYFQLSHFYMVLLIVSRILHNSIFLINIDQILHNSTFLINVNTILFIIVSMLPSRYITNMLNTC